MATIQLNDTVLEAPFPPQGSGINTQEWAQSGREDRLRLLMESDRPAGGPKAPKHVAVETTAVRPETEAAAPPDFEARKEALLRNLPGARGNGLMSPINIT